MQSETIQIALVHLFRMLNRILPFEGRYKPLFRGLVPGELIWTPWGKHIISFPRNWFDLGAGDYCFKSPQGFLPEFFDLISERLGKLPPGIIVDVGANLGAYSLLFAEYSGRSVAAYEPNPEVYTMLQRNLARNLPHKIQAFAKGVGKESGDIQFYTGVNGFPGGGKFSGDSENQVMVPVVPLDEEEVLRGPVSLIKIDCEGYEGQVIEGARGIIETKKPVLFVEIHPLAIGGFGYSAKKIVDLLPLEYEIEFYYYDDYRPSMLGRFLSRYVKQSPQRYDLDGVEALMEKNSKITQIFMLAVPKLAAGKD